MKTEEITNGNKLIAEFMGATFRPQRISENATILKCYWTDYSPTYDGININLLKYNESWDWLMPVVEKIATIPTNYPNGIFKYLVNIELNLITGIKIEDMYKRNFDQDGFSFEEYKFSFIENVWLGCVEFIKWYNENHKN